MHHQQNIANGLIALNDRIIGKKRGGILNINLYHLANCLLQKNLLKIIGQLDQ